MAEGAKADGSIDIPKPCCVRIGGGCAGFVTVR